jgi:flagellar biosynthesis/type III secretory pathway M-ring protein FliF/YscJ
VNKEEEKEKEKETSSVCNRSHRSSCIFIEATVLNAAVIPAIDFFALRILIRDPPEKQKQKQKEKQKEKEKEKEEQEEKQSESECNDLKPSELCRKQPPTLSQ